MAGRVALAAIGLLGLCGASALADDQLAVRVHDAVGAPGGRIAVVLRTYASRPIGQGELCLSLATSVLRPGGTVEALYGFRVFSDVPDVLSDATGDVLADPQTFLLSFSSPSATINASDGPLAVYFMQLAESVLPGETFDLSIDVANSTLLDENGLPIEILARNGKLTIRAPGDPYAVAADAEKTTPGDVARVAFQTNEPFPIGSGRVGFRYDSTIAAGAPTVSMDPRHGAATFTADVSTPELVIVEFQSADGSLNTVPGDLIEIRVPTLASIPPGSESAVSLDEGLTFLMGTGSQLFPLALEDDVLLFVDAAGGSPGEASGLRVAPLSGDLLQLTWDDDCGSGLGYAIYRGDLASGYDSIAPLPGFCAQGGNSAVIPSGIGNADFFLVVPFLNGLEGSYGADSQGGARPAAAGACYPEGVVDGCAP